MLLAFSLRNLLLNWMKKCTGFYIMTDICCMRDCFIRDFSWFPVSLSKHHASSNCSFKIILSGNFYNDHSVLVLGTDSVFGV